MSKSQLPAVLANLKPFPSRINLSAQIAKNKADDEAYAKRVGWIPPSQRKGKQEPPPKK